MNDYAYVARAVSRPHQLGKYGWYSRALCLSCNFLHRRDTDRAGALGREHCRFSRYGDCIVQPKM